MSRETPDQRRARREAEMEARKEAWVAAQVAKMPPLTDEQVAKIVALLSPYAYSKRH